MDAPAPPSPPRTAGPLRRAARALAHPLWRESPALRARRRCRLAFTLPFSTIAGFAWGFFAAPALGGMPTLGWAALGATAFDLFVYLQERLLPAVRHLSAKVGLGGVGGLLWEGGVVALLLFLVVDVAGAPIIPAATFAAILGGLWVWGLDYLLCGSGAGDLASVFLPTRFGGPRYRGGHSHAEAMAVRGDVEGALDVYMEALHRDPGDVVPHTRAATLLLGRDGPGDAERALELLRRAFRNARTDPAGDAFLVRRIMDVSARTPAGERGAAPDLARLAERHPDGGEGRWARETLARMKEEMLEERGV